MSKPMVDELTKDEAKAVSQLAAVFRQRGIDILGIVVLSEDDHMAFSLHPGLLKDPMVAVEAYRHIAQTALASIDALKADPKLLQRELKPTRGHFHRITTETQPANGGGEKP
jgi:hypothetical protein